MLTIKKHNQSDTPVTDVEYQAITAEQKKVSKVTLIIPKEASQYAVKTSQFTLEVTIL